MKKHHIITQILRISCFIFLFSRGILYLVFGSPLRALLWNESILRPFIELSGFSWSDYANSSNATIAIMEQFIGVFLMLTSFFFLTITQITKSKLPFYCISISGIFTLLHLILKYLGHNEEFPILPEYILQGFCPWIFLALLNYMPMRKDTPWNYPSDLLIFCIKFMISMCFIGHGLYAAGLPYQPVHFVRMLSKTLFIDFSTASLIVTCIGIIDIILGITIFIKPLLKISLAHMAFWGFVTAGARVINYVIVPMQWSNINPWLFETTVRIMHGALPLILLWILVRVKPQRQAIDWYALKNRLWEVRLTILICIVIFITLFTFIKSSNVRIENKRQLLLMQNKKQLNSKYQFLPSKHQLPINLHNTKFSRSASGKWFSDALFANDMFPVRLVLNISSLKDADNYMKEIEPFYYNRQFILTQVRKQILNSYRDPLQNHQIRDFNDEKITGFIKKVVYIMERENKLIVHVYAPWLKEKYFSSEFNSRDFN